MSRVRNYGVTLRQFAARVPVIGRSVRRRQALEHADRIRPGLTVGNADAAELLREGDYDRVFSVADGLTVEATTDSYDLNVDDRVHEQVAELHDAVASLHEALESGEDCFVHCWQGMERAPTVTAVALARMEGLKFSEAVDLIRASRPVTDPTPELREVGRRAVEVESDEAGRADD